jgi:hypothetical protein
MRRNVGQLEKIVSDTKILVGGHSRPAFPPTTGQNSSRKIAISACNPVFPPQPTQTKQLPL